MSQKKTKSQKKESKDPFGRLKYIAYCRNFMAPEEFSLSELTKYAKNYLCLNKKVLYYDPIWDLYTEEAILIEFYSLRMWEDDDYRQDIETAIKGAGKTEADDFSWMEKRQAEEDAKRDERIKELKEEADFSYSSEKNEE